MIAGFDLPTEGTVRLHGDDVTRRAPYERDVNTVFQDYALFPHMSVESNVGYGLMVKGVPARGAASGWTRPSNWFGGKRKPSQLSGDSASASRWPGR